MAMSLLQFRIQNYRIIEDTGWIDVDNVTALVGVNESGKSAILNALYKLNPSIPTSYDGLSEFPHDRFHEFTDKGKGIPVAAARFAISDGLRQDLAEIHTLYTASDTVECQKYYNGDLSVTFLPPIDFDTLTLDRVRAFLSDSETRVQRTKISADQVEIPTPAVSGDEAEVIAFNPKTVIGEFKAELLSYLDNFKNNLKSSDTDKMLADGLLKLSQTLRAVSTDEWQIDLINPIVHQINVLIDIQSSRSTLSDAVETVKNHLPIFILFEDYGTLRGDIYIPEYLRVYKAEKPPEWVRTANALFKLASYPINTVAELYRQTQQTTATSKQESRQLTKEEEEAIQRATRESVIRKEASSLWITQRFNKWWPVGDYKIHLEPVVDHFQLRVSDARRDISVELEYRSRGFKYFLSFFLVFEAESDGGHRDAILLLDEPGIHLHPGAQKLLLKFFDKVAETNQLLYTTHLPFLIDGHRLERVRAVQQSRENGETYVTDYLGTSKDGATLLPIQDALGYAVSQTLFMGKRSLIVEGWTDYWTLKTMDKLFADANKPGLDPDIYVTPSGGTHTIPWNAQLIASQDVPFVILLDSDKAGESAKNDMIQKLVALSEQFVMLGEVIGQPGIDFEGLFPPDYFIDATVQAYQIPVFHEADLNRGSNIGLGEAIRRYFDKKGHGTFEKAKVYLWLLRQWTAQTVNDLPPTFVKNIEKIFQSINAQFSKLDN